MARPKSKEGAERISTTVPKTIKRWLIKNGGQSVAIQRLVAEKMEAEKGE